MAQPSARERSGHSARILVCMRSCRSGLRLRPCCMRGCSSRQSVVVVVVFPYVTFQCHCPRSPAILLGPIHGALVQNLLLRALMQHMLLGALVHNMLGALG